MWCNVNTLKKEKEVSHVYHISMLAFSQEKGLPRGPPLTWGTSSKSR